MFRLFNMMKKFLNLVLNVLLNNVELIIVKDVMLLVFSIII